MKLLKPIKTIKFFLFGLSILFLSSCSSNNTASLKAIPKEANMVTVVDVFSIIKKAKLDEITDFKFFKTFKREIRNENKRISRLMDNVMENPKTTGIDFTENLFTYYVDNAKDEMFFCMAADLSDTNKFNEFIKDVLDNAKTPYTIEEEKDYKYTIVNNGAIIGWDKHKVLILTASNYKSRKNLEFAIETLFKLKEIEQITIKEEFKKFYNTKKDLGVWLSSNWLESFDDYNRLKKEIDFDIADSYLSAYLNFEGDAISLKGEIIPNVELKKIMEEHDIMGLKFNTKLLNFLPIENLLSSSISLDSEAFYNMLAEEKDFKSLDTQFSNEIGFSLEEIILSLKGSAIFNLSDFEQRQYTYSSYERIYNPKKFKHYSSWEQEYTYSGGYEYRDTLKTKEILVPVFGLAFDVKTDKYIKNIFELFYEDNMEKHEDYYKIQLNKKHFTFLAFNDDVCFLTNNKKSIEAFKKEGLKIENLSDSHVANNHKQNNFYTYMNLNYNDYPKEIKKEINGEQSDKERKLLKNWGRFAKSIELKQSDNYSMELILTLSESDNNSLNTLITAFDDNYDELLAL